MLKVGVVQFRAMEGDIEGNLRHLEEVTEKHASDDIDLLCFPELCISGYNFEKARDSLQEKAFFSELARKHKIAIMAGVNVPEDGKYYDAACLFSETGELLGEYKKIHLWDKECEFFERGQDITVIPFRGWNIGLLICADMRFSEVSTPLTNMGADVIIYPSAWIKGWEDLFTLCGRMRAAENQIYTIALNRATGDTKYCGHTSVMNPDGSIQCRIESEDEGYMRAELHKDDVRKARERLEWQSLKLPHIYKRFEQYRFASPNGSDIHTD